MDAPVSDFVAAMTRGHRSPSDDAPLIIAGMVAVYVLIVVWAWPCLWSWRKRNDE